MYVFVSNLYEIKGKRVNIKHNNITVLIVI